MSEYGTYSQATLITNTVKSSSLLGLTSACNYFYNSTKEDYEQRKYITLIVFVELFIGVICSFGLVVLSNTLSIYFNNEELRSFIFLIALTPLLENILSIYQTLYISVGRAKTIAIRNVIVSMCKLSGALIACYIYKNIKTVLIVLLVVDILQTLYFAKSFYKFKKFVSVRELRKDDIVKVFSYSIPLFLYTVTGTLSNDLDKYIIGIFCDKETLAIYSNAAKRLPLEIIVTSFLTVLAPIITRQINGGDKKDAKVLFKQYLRIGYITTYCLGGGAIALSGTLIQFLYDPKYLPGHYVFIIYIAIEMIRFANATIILTAFGKTKVIMYSSIVMLSLNLIFNIIFFKIFGIVGPALCTFILSFLYSLYLLMYGSKLLETSIVEIINFKELLIFVIEVCIFGFISLIIHLKLSTIINLYFSMIVSYCFYLLLMAMFNFKKVKECLKQINKYR